MLCLVLAVGRSKWDDDISNAGDGECDGGRVRKRITSPKSACGMYERCVRGGTDEGESEAERTYAVCRNQGHVYHNWLLKGQVARGSVFFVAPTLV